MSEPDQQAWWIEHAARGDKGVLPHQRGAKRALTPRTVRTVDLEGPQLRAIHDARQLARLVVGLPLSDCHADTLGLDRWRERADGKALLCQARQAPPPPAPRTPPRWCDIPDPATPLLGPWLEPRDLPHALRLLEQAQVARDSRVLLMGQAFDRVASRKLYRELGFRSLQALADDGLDCSIRTLERHRALAEDVALLPDLARAIEGGLDLARARLVASIACEDTVDSWLEVACNTGLAELGRAVSLAGRAASKRVGAQVLASYQRAIALADQIVAHVLVINTTDTGAAPSPPAPLPEGLTLGHT